MNTKSNTRKLTPEELETRGEMIADLVKLYGKERACRMLDDPGILRIFNAAAALEHQWKTQRKA